MRSSNSRELDAILTLRSQGAVSIYRHGWPDFLVVMSLQKHLCAIDLQIRELADAIAESAGRGQNAEQPRSALA